MRITIREKDATRFSKDEASQKGKEFVQEGYRVRDADIFLRNEWKFSVLKASGTGSNWYVVLVQLDLPDGDIISIGYLV